MNKKKIAFISPIWNGGPTELYKNLVTELNKYDTIECTHIQSISWWFWAHFNNKYDVIISVVPFFWRPPRCKFILNIHWLFRQDRWFFNAWALLNWFYPYNTLFADTILYPSNYLKEYCNFKNLSQLIIWNFCDIEIQKPKIFQRKENYELITVTGFQFYEKARWVIQLAQYLKNYNEWISLKWSIIGSGTYFNEIRNQTEVILKNKKNIQVDFVGFVDRVNILHLLRHSDIFIYATYCETFGIAILEAISTWMPAILLNHQVFVENFHKSMIVENENQFNKRLGALLSSGESYTNASNFSIETAKKYEKSLTVEKWLKFITSV